MSTQNQTPTGAKKSNRQNPESKTKGKGKGGDPVQLSNEELEKRRISRREELGELSDDELRERFKNANGTEANEDLTREHLIELLIDLGSDMPSPDLGNADEDEDDEETQKSGESKIPRSIRFAADGKTETDWRDSVVVKLTPTEFVNNQLVELDKSAYHQTFSQEKFDQMVEDGFFKDSKLKVEVLHKPSGKSAPAKGNAPAKGKK